MKILALIATLLMSGASMTGASVKLEDISPHFPANANIVWKASTEKLPKTLPIYVTTPRTFPAFLVSNAVVLASFPFTNLDFSGTKEISIRDGHDDFWSRQLNILPSWGQINYVTRSDLTNSTDIPNAKEVSSRAWEIAAEFGLPRSELVEKAESRKSDKCENDVTNAVCARETFLTRRLHGIEMRDFGLAVKLGGHSKVRGFCLLWPDVKIDNEVPLANARQFIQSIRERKTPLSLTSDGAVEWDKLKALNATLKFTITNVNVYFAEGRFGVDDNTNGYTRYISPFAELEGIAELQNTNLIIRLFCPAVTESVH